MTIKKGVIVLFAILMISLTMTHVQATWITEQIQQSEDDGFFTETGSSFFDTPWVQVKGSSSSIGSYFVFRGVDLPQNASVTDAYLEFTAPAAWSWNQTLDATVYGLKRGDQPSWDPTPALLSEPVTSANYDFSVGPLFSGNQLNVSVLNIILEIQEMYAWDEGNDLGFGILSIAESYGARYQVAYDSKPGSSLKLYINYLDANDTVTYYKGFEIRKTTTGTGFAITYQNFDDTQMKLATADGTDYQFEDTFSITGAGGFAPDGVVTVGTDYYMVFINSITFNRSLMRSQDRGATWINVGEVASNAVLSSAAQYALAYDANNTIWISYAHGFQTWVRNFTVSTQTLSGAVMIYDGQYNVHQHRAYYEPINDAIWLTRYGGSSAGSTRKATVLRKIGSSPWESYTHPTAYRVSDITYADSVMYWVIHDYDVTPANSYFRLFELTNYSDITSWSNVGSTIGSPLTLNAVQGESMDIGTRWGKDLFGAPMEYAVISFERQNGTRQIIWQNEWKRGDWYSDSFNLTALFPTFTNFYNPKMYYVGDNLMMVIKTVTAGESRLIWNGWGYFTYHHTFSIGKKFLETNDQIQGIGGDMFPTTPGFTGYFDYDVYDENGTFTGSFETEEDAQAFIDSIGGVGQTPDDPDPPGTNYPPDGIGQITRFNMRFYIWLIGWVLIFIPPLAMAYKSYDLQMYLVFFIVEVTGWALLWSIASI